MIAASSCSCSGMLATIDDSVTTATLLTIDLCTARCLSLVYRAENTLRPLRGHQIHHRPLAFHDVVDIYPMDNGAGKDRCMIDRRLNTECLDDVSRDGLPIAAL